VSVIGIEMPADSLVLTAGRDFKWNFEFVNDAGEPEDYPAGDLYFEFPTVLDGDDPVRWTFTIADSVATLKVESTEADAIPDRTKWQLVFLPDGEPTGGDPVAIGKVKRQG
jgi:hypothetical protein